MQGTRIRLLLGGLLMASACSNVQAEALQPDPAWQQGKLDNGFTWQLLTTPQRPNDRIELRLLVRTGSLAENPQQQGFAHFLPRLALIRSEGFTTAQLQSFWQQAIDNQRPMSPAITSYDFTSYNLSLPNGRPDLMKTALNWLVDTSGKMVITQDSVHAAYQAPQDPIDSLPPDSQDAWWRYRISGSTLVGHSPELLPAKVAKPADLSKFYHQWYTPDAMTLYVVGNVDGRAMAEQIKSAFSSLKGSRQTPQTLPTLSDVPPQAMAAFDPSLTQDRLSLMWSMPWQPIQDSPALNAYWRSDLAREALFLHLQQALKKPGDEKEGGAVQPALGFDCRVQYQHAQCAIRLEAPQSAIQPALKRLANELVKVRDTGLSQAEFDALIAQKKDQLGQLFATYARTDTGVLMSQRLRSQQNAVVDIAPEQYQKLRQAFLSTLTLPDFNQELKQQLSHDPSLLLIQPKGENELSVKTLQETYDSIVVPVATPADAQTSDSTTAATSPGASATGTAQ
ncbi:insulinase family protein [Rouxiella badensis]|jgi:zinc protease|uniref:Peptidase M16 n=1 Tax=Rouxiella badensis TaxID=1646377 RepID=A0A1X0WBW5_9GAMM|nr:pitrilysin family protein [Rouxiella badensis]MCC3702849.1 insulinase family protein [Rouxiella badensis]MCC3748338.1 insulinase family protein [Rouxiella badensis]ORJ24287.1 peptidase M16 [Rouxiella badensis]QOI56938.1 insulinase family protein [Rouxiella badensis subsp. acadiensis]